MSVSENVHIEAGQNRVSKSRFSVFGTYRYFLGTFWDRKKMTLDRAIRFGNDNSESVYEAGGY